MILGVDVGFPGPADDVVLAAAAAVTAIGVLWRATRNPRRKLTAAVHKTNQVADVLLGRPAIRHPDTGVELAPPQPGIGARLSAIEEAIAQQAANAEDLRRAHDRIDSLERRIADHLASEHEARIAAHEESQQMWQAIEAIARTGNLGGGS